LFGRIGSLFSRKKPVVVKLEDEDYKEKCANYWDSNNIHGFILEKLHEFEIIEGIVLRNFKLQKKYRKQMIDLVGSMLEFVSKYPPSEDKMFISIKEEFLYSYCKRDPPNVQRLRALYDLYFSQIVDDLEFYQIPKNIYSKMQEIIEYLKTRSHIDALNHVNTALRPKLEESSLEKVEKDVVESMLKWIYDLINNSPLTPEEREMRINQAVISCFLLHGSRECPYRILFKRYVAPFLVEPGCSKKQVVERIKNKLRKLCKRKKTKKIS